MTYKIKQYLVMAFAFQLSGFLSAQEARIDLPGAQDHPLIKRFTGSWLAGYRADAFSQGVFPVSDKVDKDKLVEPVVIEGKVFKLHYIAPTGKSTLEVHRNYEQALQAAGFVQKYACQLAACSNVFFALSLGDGAKWADGAIVSPDKKNRYQASAAPSYEEAHLSYGTITKNGSLVHVMIYTSVAAFKITESAYTYIQIAEPKAMQTGQVSVDTNALKAGIEADGKIALYGVYFDTGKSVVKPESKMQMDEIAKLMQSQPSLKLIIVGHTDNQGTIESNLVLSQQRAEAVSQFLILNNKIPANRLIARGVANYSPVATNISEAGRAKNRRVELVAQ